MPRRVYSDEEILRVVAEAQTTDDLGAMLRRTGVSEATCYRWRQKYAGLDLAGLRRLRALEKENVQLRRRLAQLLDDPAD